MKGKKNEFVFTIGFKRTDPEHVRVVNILNETDSKNQFIVDAVLCYVDSGYMNVRPWNIQPAFRQTGSAPVPLQNSGEYEQAEEEQKIDDTDINNIMQTIQSFRS